VTARKLLLAYAGDLVLGAPEDVGPLETFGSLAARVQEFAYAPDRNRGALVTGVLVGSAAFSARRAGMVKTVWATLDGHRLRDQAQELNYLLEQGQIGDAQELLAELTGAEADAAAIVEVAVDWLARGVADGVVGPLFWAALLGPAGAASYAAVNTLDARLDEHEQFGWAAALLAETMNWPVTRLTAGLSALVTPLLPTNDDEFTRAINRSLYVGAAAALCCAALRWGLNKPHRRAG
jgi:adenosylcobinamide-phosphate synthase